MIQGLNYNRGKRFSLLQDVKQPGHATDHSLPTSDEVKKEYSYTSIPPIMPGKLYILPLINVNVPSYHF
jgi:hypothetical protein